MSLMLVLEILWRAYIQGDTYLWKASNIFDLVVVGLSSLGICLALFIPEKLEDIEGISNEVVLFVRSIILYLRLIVYIKN